MARTTQQMEKWSGEFGKEYTDRILALTDDLDTRYKKRYGVTRTEMNLEFIGSLDHSIHILEVGSNTGNQLICLQNMGFKHLYGIELQEYAVELSKTQTRNINIINGSALDIPFKDNFFDLVFTAGVLIHISPRDIKKIIKEIYRCSKKYIWGFEYFAESFTEVEYRGNSEMMWKADYAKIYQDTFGDVKLLKKKICRYPDKDIEDSMFLLEKEQVAES